ncbi:MAG: acylphosphatase [Acidobacteriota bacterium]|nr:acylphosphatase [Acidobacteriota bacterium]
MIRVRQFLIAGRVQGVGFRFFAREAAVREGLRGFVRNLEDGRVEVQAEGDQAALERFERALHQGPPGAEILDVAMSELPPVGQTPLFQIRV